MYYLKNMQMRVTPCVVCTEVVAGWWHEVRVGRYGTILFWVGVVDRWLIASDLGVPVGDT